MAFRPQLHMHYVCPTPHTHTSGWSNGAAESSAAWHSRASSCPVCPCACAGSMDSYTFRRWRRQHVSCMVHRGCAASDAGHMAINVRLHAQVQRARRSGQVWVTHSLLAQSLSSRQPGCAAACRSRAAAVRPAPVPPVPRPGWACKVQREMRASGKCLGSEAPPPRPQSVRRDESDADGETACREYLTGLAGQAPRVLARSTAERRAET